MKAIVWNRVSTKDQSEANQMPDQLRHCRERDYEVRDDLIFNVHGKSAFKGAQDRDWQKVVKLVKEHRAQVVVIWKVDRQDRRGLLHAVPMVNMVIEAGGKVEFSSQPYIDLTTMPGRMAFANLCEMAHEESKTRSDRTRAGHARIRENRALSGRLPFGYAAVAGEKYRHSGEPTEEGRLYAAEMFARYAGLELDAEGRVAGRREPQSGRQVAEWLSAQIGRPVWDATLYSWLRNTTYVGRRRDADGVTVCEVEPLVRPEVWRAANDRLDSRPSKRGANPGKDHMLTGLVKCFECSAIEGRPMPMSRIYTGSPRSRVAQMRCTGRGAARKSCGALVRMDLLLGLLDKAMAEFTAEIVLREFVPGHDHSGEVEALGQAMDDVWARCRRGDIDRRERDRLIRDLEDQQDDLRKLPVVPDSWREIPTGVTYAAKWADLDERGRREFLVEEGLRVEFAWLPGLDGGRQPALRVVGGAWERMAPEMAKAAASAWDAAREGGVLDALRA